MSAASTPPDVKPEPPDGGSPTSEQGGVAILPKKRRRINLGFDRFSGIYTFAVIILIFGLWVPTLFLQVDNFKTILDESAITGMMALAILVPLAAGAYDLSIGGVMSVAMLLSAWLQSVHHWNAIPAVLVTIALSAFVGALNGVSVVFLRVNSFIATLAMSSILAAVELAISGGNQIVTGISQTFINSGQSQLFGLALPVYYLLGLAIVLYFVLEHTPFGRYLFAVGDNVDATRLSGVRTGRLTFGALMISATVAGMAGIVLCAVVGSYSVDSGAAYLLPAFAAAFLGSTQLKPGRFTCGERFSRFTCSPPASTASVWPVRPLGSASCSTASPS